MSHCAEAIDPGQGSFVQAIHASRAIVSLRVSLHAREVVPFTRVAAIAWPRTALDACKRHAAERIVRNVTQLPRFVLSVLILGVLR